MEAQTTANFQINTQDYTNAIINGEKFFIQFQQFSEDVETQIIKIIHRYLQQYDLLFYRDIILSIIKELINNAVKSNLKRAYFIEKNLDINKTVDYRSGMEHFKEETLDSGDDKKLEALNGSKYHVRCAFSVNDKRINIQVINNVPILEAELNKIQARVQKALEYSDISEAFEDILDDSEGAGLGLIMAIMLLKNSGFPRDSFAISSNDKLTLIQISIPYQMVSRESHIKISKIILDEIQNIPSLPGTIKEIRRLTKDPESTMQTIASAIEKDPGIAASIIHLSNSAGYITSKRIESIEEALKTVGLKGLNTLLIASGVEDVMGKKYREFSTIWEISQKRANYAAFLMKNRLKNKQFGDQAYLAALLADIGKIVMLSIDSKLFTILREIAGIKGIENTSSIEEISLGISHNALGALICKEWNFTETLTKTIQNYCSPHLAEKELIPLIYTVYLANVLINIEKRKFRYELIDDDVLAYFDLTDKGVFEALHKEIQERNQEPD